MTKKVENNLCSFRDKALQGCQIQVQTCFRLVEINFLLSIILGTAFWHYLKNIKSKCISDIDHLKLLIQL